MSVRPAAEVWGSKKQRSQCEDWFSDDCATVLSHSICLAVEKDRSAGIVWQTNFLFHLV